MKPPVEAPASRQRRPATTQARRLEGVQRPGQLVAAAGDVVGTVGVGARPRSRRRWSPRWPAWSRPRPTPCTRPAATSSAACSRDRARPRRTSSASRRSRRGGTAVSRRVVERRPQLGCACSRARRSPVVGRLERRDVLRQRPLARAASTSARRPRRPSGRAGPRRRARRLRRSGSIAHAGYRPVGRRRRPRPSASATLPGVVEVRPRRARRPRATSRRRSPSPVDLEARRPRDRASSRPAAQPPVAAASGAAAARASARQVGADVGRPHLGPAPRPARPARSPRSAPAGCRSPALRPPAMSVSSRSPTISGRSPADPSHRLVEQRARRLARHDRLDAGEAAQRVDQHPVARRHPVGGGDGHVGVARHPPQPVADPHRRAHHVAPRARRARSR